jgi:hypothetical protein
MYLKATSGILPQSIILPRAPIVRLGKRPSRPSCSPYSPFLASLLKPLSLAPLKALRVAVGCHALPPRSYFTCRSSKLEWHKRLAARRPERHSPRCCLQGYLRLIGRRLFTDMRARFLASIDVALICALLPSCNNPRAKIRAHERLSMYRDRRCRAVGRRRPACRREGRVFPSSTASFSPKYCEMDSAEEAKREREQRPPKVEVVSFFVISGYCWDVFCSSRPTTVARP